MRASHDIGTSFLRPARPRAGQKLNMTALSRLTHWKLTLGISVITMWSQAGGAAAPSRREDNSGVSQPAYTGMSALPSQTPSMLIC